MLYAGIQTEGAGDYGVFIFSHIISLNARGCVGRRSMCAGGAVVANDVNADIETDKEEALTKSERSQWQAQ